VMERRTALARSLGGIGLLIRRLVGAWGHRATMIAAT
jgi:hypothetical protein